MTRRQLLMPAGRRRGFTLMEVLIAMALFLIGAVALLIAVFGRYLNPQTVAE